MNREEARKYFKDLGLSYDIVTPLQMRKLANMIEVELIDYLENGEFHAGQMNMRVASQKVKNTKFLDNKLIYYFIKIDGAYFKEREGISFNEKGFIGFGGEFSDVNVAPILKAFCKWCNDLVKQPKMVTV